MKLSIGIYQFRLFLSIQMPDTRYHKITVYQWTYILNTFTVKSFITDLQ